LALLAGVGEFPERHGAGPGLDEAVQAEPARATDRAVSAAAAGTTIPTTFQVRVVRSRLTYGRAEPPVPGQIRVTKARAMLDGGQGSAGDHRLCRLELAHGDGLTGPHLVLEQQPLDVE